MYRYLSCIEDQDISRRVYQRLLVPFVDPYPDHVE